MIYDLTYEFDSLTVKTKTNHNLHLKLSFEMEKLQKHVLIEYQNSFNAISQTFKSMNRIKVCIKRLLQFSIILTQIYFSDNEF